MTGTALGVITSTTQMQKMDSTNSGNASTSLAINAAAPFTRLCIFTAIGSPITVTSTGTQTAGQELTFKIINDATSGRTITFSTGFSANGNLVGVVSKISTISFISDGTTFYETCRVVGVL